MKAPTKPAISLALILVFLAQAACNFPGFRASEEDPAATLNALYTQSAQTLAAMASQSAAQTVAPTLGYASPTPLLQTVTFAPAIGTATPIRTSAPVTRCDGADFVDDVTYPDGSVIGRNEPFTKVWRLKNIGTCSWTTGYALVFVEGDAMSAPVAIALPGTVNPGQTVDIPVNMISPFADGRYKGYFKLRNASGVLFGVGTQASTAFWVDVRVSGQNYVAYDLAANLCDAEWNNGGSFLACPGMEGDVAGYSLYLNNPKLEDGTEPGNGGLLMVPGDASNAFIQGIFPPIQIQDGDRFRSIINCRYNSVGCDVIFRLDYQIGNGALQPLGQWHEVYEGKWYSLDINLSALKGQNVKLYLTVYANGASFKDFAVWIGPHILRPGVPPPTNTPTATATSTLTATATATSTVTPTETPTATTAP
jgi:hypothetical protein